MNRIIQIVFAIAVSLISTSCVGNRTQITADSSLVTGTGQGRTVSASACGFQLMLFIPINTNTRHERAYNLLLKRAGSDPITDVKVQERWFYGFVGTGYCTRFEATAYSKG